MRYTLYIVKFGPRDHRPYLIASNGKIPLNEPNVRAIDLEKTWANLCAAIRLDNVDCVRISAEAFRKKFPQFPANSGPKPKTKTTK